ncbi:vacuolar amino acid transporter 1-like [Phalaenopsis equestris]|uniref:vacuolar amino acid transporter 1-like n=1 Tax=Phalaenopsis equestris TaxID=78828 RepID=UPI0009E1DBCC|nr:vacuolar amino acid transporter 1-like [Phalaenopsis equestris]
MKNPAMDPSIYVENSDAEGGVDDEEQSKIRAEEDDDEESDGSDSSSGGSTRRSRPNSYNTTWPQSYRQSIDIYSGVTPPTIGFLGTPNLSRFGSSFLNNSFRGRHTSEILNSLIKPLLPTQAEDEQQQRKSSHLLVIAPRQCSYTQGVFNGVNVLCGVGILSAPYAIKEGGWLGLFILFIYGVIAFYTGILLRNCLDSKPGLETYPDIGQAAFGPYGRIIISIILYLELYACCVEYIILDSDNLSSLFPNAHLNIGGIHLSSHLLFAVLVTLIVLPTTWLRDLSILSYISAGGVIASILVVSCLFWVGLIDNIGYKNEGSLINFSGISIAIGLYGYSYSGHAIFPNIYSSLKNKNEFPAVLFTSFVISALLFAGVAIMGFALFGESTQSQFTLNVPYEFVASKIAVWTTVVNPITKYSITLAPMALSLEELIPTERLESYWYAIIMRTALTISSLVVAMSVPFFGLVMALIGSLLTMLLAFILPCVCFLCIARNKASWPQVAMCALVLIVGVSSSAIGTYSAISKIIDKLR